MTTETLELLKEIRREVAWGILNSHQHSGKCNAKKALEIVMGIIEREGVKYAQEVLQAAQAGDSH